MPVYAAVFMHHIGSGGVFARYIVDHKVEIRMRVDYAVVEGSLVLNVHGSLDYILEGECTDAVANLCTFDQHVKRPWSLFDVPPRNANSRGVERGVENDEIGRSEHMVFVVTYESIVGCARRRDVSVYRIFRASHSVRLEASGYRRVKEACGGDARWQRLSSCDRNLARKN